MLQTMVTFEGNIAADIELAYTPSGKQVVRFPVLVNRRRKDPTPGSGVTGSRPGTPASRSGAGRAHCRQPVQGDRVLVVGNVVTDAWEDKVTRDKRTAQRVLVDAAGPSLRYATATVRKAQRTSAGQADDEATTE